MPVTDHQKEASPNKWRCHVREYGDVLNGSMFLIPNSTGSLNLYYDQLRTSLIRSAAFPSASQRLGDLRKILSTSRRRSFRRCLAFFASRFSFLFMSPTPQAEDVLFSTGSDAKTPALASLPCTLFQQNACRTSRTCGTMSARLCALAGATAHCQVFVFVSSRLFLCAVMVSAATRKPLQSTTETRATKNTVKKCPISASTGNRPDQPQISPTLP